VITSSITAPDLQAICRDAIGRDVISWQPIGAGGNSRVYCVDLEGVPPVRFVVKFYRSDPGDPRDRLGTEFGSLQFLWQNGVRAVPCPIAIDRARGCALYEHIAGEPSSSHGCTSADVDASVDFLGALKRLREVRGSDALPPASEACFSLGTIVASITHRLARLRRDAGGGDVPALGRWIDRTFVTLMTEANRWCRDAALQCGIPFDEPIGPDARTLSPSDFGFHNAIRRPDGSLAFVDFEYFGWDDPAKTIVDYVLHPGMALEDPLKHHFAARAEALFADIPGLAARARIVYPLFGLKWALILLNEFLPERAAGSTIERRRSQLDKAQALADRVAEEYTRNPYFS
jgi:Phosphotransferase enzyme family